MPVIYVDLIDACHLRCPTCVRGTRLLPNSARRMPLDLFERIVAKARQEGYDTVGLYNWTEPFLNPRIPDYVRLVKSAGLACDASSTLSLRARTDLIAETLRAGLDKLIVSLSGFTQETHAVNHRGGDLALVKQNLETISRLRAAERIPTEVVLRFLRFDHNADDAGPLADYARRLGFAFEILPGVGMVDNPISNYVHEDVYRSRLANYSPARPHERPGEVCPLIMETIAVDAGGMVSLCCANPSFPALEIGPYLELTGPEILLARYTHPICPSCAFPRRAATADDGARLLDALASRLCLADAAPPGVSTTATDETILTPLHRRLQTWLARGRRLLQQRRTT